MEGKVLARGVEGALDEQGLAAQQGAAELVDEQAVAAAAVQAELVREQPLELLARRQAPLQPQARKQPAALGLPPLARLPAPLAAAPVRQAHLTAAQLLTTRHLHLTCMLFFVIIVVVIIVVIVIDVVIAVVFVFVFVFVIVFVAFNQMDFT